MNKKDILRIIKYAVYAIFGTGKLKRKTVENFAMNLRNKKILEIGSGKKENGEHNYSTIKFFHKSNTFIQSDINPEYGHKVIDITKMKYKNEFDVIICLSVLEHVYDFNSAIKNLYNSLKKDGTLLLYLPFLYPLHDEPQDYWRFTEHSIRKLLVNFSKIEIKHSGIRSYPLTYFIKATK